MNVKFVADPFSLLSCSADRQLWAKLFLQKERTSHSGNYQPFSTGKDGAKCMPCFPPLCFCKDDCVQVGMVAIPLLLVPSSQDRTDSESSWQGCKFCVWGSCGIEPSCKPYPVWGSNMMWLKPVCDEWLNFRGQKVQCKNQLLLCGCCDTDEMSTARWSKGSFGLGYV